jgi:ABC-type multidrug transport system fused ATPase/permease subunit
VRLVITPPNTNDYVADQRETFLQTPREFLIEHDLQVAINSGYFGPPSSYDLTSGTPTFLQGAIISQGRMVSAQTRTNDSMSAMMFETNNQASFYFLNWPAAATNNVLNAVSGMYPLVSNGVNFAYFYTNALSDSIHNQPQPRTAFGLSQDNRYLIMITLDGRQNFSEGAFDYETAEFLLLFGAWNGMNMDGGGSTCRVKADEFSDAVDLNVNSFQWAVGRPGSQRSIGCNFGVRTVLAASPIKDLVIQPGTTTAIVGSTGSGKTTLISLIPRFYEVTGGSVLVDGVDVRKLSQQDLWRRIGLVPQKSFLFSGSVADNLRHGDDEAAEERLWRYLEIAQGRDFVEEMPEGLETHVAQGGASVSGGQRQRLAIARALVRRPGIYLFDDSFSALDLATDARLRAALVPVTADAVTVIVAQRVSTIMNADQILVIEDGREVGLGTHRELLQTCPTYAEIVASQLSAEEAA